MVPPHKHVIVPTKDLLTALKVCLMPYGLSEAAFEELVRQCFDVYMNWDGCEEQIDLLPYFNRIVIPAMRGDRYQDVRDSTEHAVQLFAGDLFKRLMEHGFFPKSHTSPNMDYAFLQFIDNNVMLQYFQF